MQGTERLTHITLVEKEIHKLQPGEMMRDSQQKHWFIGCPGLGCEGVGNLSAHTVTESNGFITVNPSILCSCGAHYFVACNQIRWC